MRSSNPFWSIIFRLLLFIALAIISIVLMVNNSVIQKYALLEKVRGVQLDIWERTNSVKDYFSLDEINMKLSTDNQKLLAENIIYKELINSLKCEKEVKQLMDSINSVENYTFVGAEVVKNMVNTSHNFIIVNKGERDGVSTDMGVITNNGVVGIVRGVGKTHSYIYSLLNSNQQLSVKVGMSNSLGILKWDGISSNGAILSEIPRHIDIKMGDTVITSGFSSMFPPNIPVGKVTKSRVIKGTHLELNVELFNDFRALDFVTLVKNNRKTEIDSLSVAL